MVIAFLTDGEPSHRDAEYAELEAHGGGRQAHLTHSRVHSLEPSTICTTWRGREGTGPISSREQSSAGKDTQLQAQSHLEACLEDSRARACSPASRLWTRAGSLSIRKVFAAAGCHGFSCQEPDLSRKW